MRSFKFNSALLKSALAASALLLGSGAAFGQQQQVSLTAGLASVTMPDGTSVPMWGYTCGAGVAGSTASCASLNPNANGGWSPVIITVPSGQDLQINLTNNLSFTPAGSTTPNNIPTSLVILGQVGGGLGNAATYAPSPAHAPQGATWFIAGNTNGAAAFNPPSQLPRVQSFSTEVSATPAGSSGSPTSLTWTKPRPGTYLLESGTHPSIQGPMGLYGIVVVTCAPTDVTSGCTTGTAYPNVAYNADVSLLLSEIDPLQNQAVQNAVSTIGFMETAVSALRDSVASVVPGADSSGNKIAGSGYNIGDVVTITGGGGAGATAHVATVDANGAILTIAIDNPGGGYSSTPTAKVTTGGGSGAQLVAGLAITPNTLSQCSYTDGTGATTPVAGCYPPAVNYTPLYYMINGVAFNKSNASASLFTASLGSSNTPVAGNVLVRLVNAGLKMHVPTIVGATTAASSLPGMSLIAEDGFPLPGVPRVQSEVFLAAGKTYDVMINAPIAGATALPIFDRELSLSANSTARDGGMLAYIGVNGNALPASVASAAAQANPDTYNALVAGQTLTISDPAKGVIANDIGVYGVALDPSNMATNGVVTLNANGTFTYVPNAGSTATSDSFGYCANGSSSICTTVSLNKSAVTDSGITCTPASFTSNVASLIGVKAPGLLAGCKDGANLAMTVVTSSITNAAILTADATGGFVATGTPGSTLTFTYQVQNSQGMLSAPVSATVTFPTGNGLQVTVLDGATKDRTNPITDYRWIIEEDRTFYVDPNCTTNPLPPTCQTVNSQGSQFNFGTNFHVGWVPVVATGCTGPQSCESGQTQGGTPVVCDVGNGVCRNTGSQLAQSDPSQVALDPKKRYYISVLPGDAANPFGAGYLGAPDCSPTGMAAGHCGHGMGGAPIAAACKPAVGTTSCTGTFAPITVLSQPSPYPPGKLTAFVFEDDYPLNGEHDAGGGVDVLAPQEPGLGNFQITLYDDAGGPGDATGTPTYDMFNQPLTNSLAGTIDPVTGLDACPISPRVTDNVLNGDQTQKGIIGIIVTCPKFESDGQTLSPLAGQVVVNNLYAGRYSVVATPGADRIARGEEWLQTNTLDGQKAHDAFIRIGEPGYFQEYGPAGYHVTIGFANPKIINDRRTNAGGSGMCDPAPAGGALTCNNTLTGTVTTGRMSRPPDERLYGSGDRTGFSFTQCYVSLGDPDGADFAFAKCDANGNFALSGIPSGNWKLTTFDQWNDQIVDGISFPIGLGCSSTTSGACQGTATQTNLNLGEIAAHQWQSNVYTRTFLDLNGNGVSDKDASGNDAEPGLALVSTNIRFRDGSFTSYNNTDLFGHANFNETFPLFNWYVLETDTTRFKNTGVHTVYDAGGPVDGSGLNGNIAPPCAASAIPCGSSMIGRSLANTYERFPLPADLSLPGAIYCLTADCTGANESIALGPVPSSGTAGMTSTGRIDPPFWWGSYAWQGYSGQSNFIEWGKKPYAVGETGGIHGHVVYAATRPFDDPQRLLQNFWEPLVPHVRVNLYREDFAADGVTPTLTLIDHMDTTSFDDWMQGFRTDASGNPVKAADGTSYVPNVSCPGQSTTDPFYYAIQDQPQWLDFYNNGPGATKALPYHSQFKCYDGMHTWNELQPAPYDGMYSFPSVTGFDPKTGKPSGTNCTACATNPDSTDPYRSGTPMLPAGKYVVEVVVPPGFELVKEEDKNILIGDNFIAPATVQLPGLGAFVFILPDQAAIGARYNANNAQNATQDLGRRNDLPSHEGDTGSVESYWPCVGEKRIVPDFLSIFPQVQEVSPFAGAYRPLCDRKEVVLSDQSSALAKFYIFTSAHVASKFTGIISDDFTSEFDPFSPAFGEKFSPAYMPVSFKDWTGNEVSRVYSDQFGTYNGLNYSTWEVNPPNPTGYAPTMMVTCMNDRGTGVNPDPLWQPGYSQFCYELAFMPGTNQYFDTPVVPTTAFADGYNHPDCNYPDATPAISSVTSSDIAGPWVAAADGTHTLTISALGDQMVDNYGYSGPQSTKAPYNQMKVNRHYGFGGTTGTVKLVSTDGTQTLALTVGPSGWTDSQITATVPALAAVPAWNCQVQQQMQYGGPATDSPALCGQLVITSSNGQSSIDTVTVTIGGKQPTVVPNGTYSTIQSAIDAAMPGDMLVVAPGVYHEMLIMWKPIRLQGVGAASAVIDADAHPSSLLLDPWRQKVVCLFGLTQSGRPNFGPNADTSCLANLNFASGGPNFPTIIVDRLPFEAILGWDATLNANLAEQLIEPSLMGAYEGAGITVVGKGIKLQAGDTDPFGAGSGAAYNTGTVLLSAADCGANSASATNPYPSNYYCNPSSIDGLGVRNSSQGGGGIFVHAYAHNLQIANNRVTNNTGTLTGGITVGMGEHPDANLAPRGSGTTVPDSCEDSNITGLALPFCFDEFVNVHHNAVTLNSGMGDELFSSTPAGAGGVTICTGADYYRFNYNWVCGNISSGDGGGMAHVGLIKNGDIEHNSILFNQSRNPTITTNGGGLLVMGAPDADPPCGATNDTDCLAAPNTVTPSDGTGQGLIINANLIVGNSAESGSGGGLRLQHVNGNDMINLPDGASVCNSIPGQCNWNSVTVTNNIITNNVAGWDGAGVSLQDALAVNLVNNTIASNDSTASAGSLFGSLFAPLASTPATNCTTPDGLQACPQVAGVVSVTHTAVLSANLPAKLTCPPGHGKNGDCKYFSNPLMYNNMIWQNRSYVVGVGNFGLAQNMQNQQRLVTLYNSNFAGAATVQVATQPAGPQTTADGLGAIITGGTGACVGGVSYWEVGVRGDTAPNAHATIAGVTLKLVPQYTEMTDASDYPGANNFAADPRFVSQYCNGSRTPPENGGPGWLVPPSTNETNAFPNQVFSLLPSATVDEGNNWINMRWGPLALNNPAVVGADGNYSGGAALGNYGPAPDSAAIDVVPTGSAAYNAAPSFDFYGKPRKTAATGFVDVGAVEVQTPFTADVAVTKVGPASAAQGTTVTYTITVTDNGPDPSRIATLTDALSSTGRFHATSWTCVASTGSNCTAAPFTGTPASLTGTVDLLNAGTATFTLVGTVPANAPLGSLTNTASVALAADVTDPNTANNSSSVTTQITPPPADLSITKTDNTGTGTIFRGQPITYTVTVTNNGPSAATGAVVTDTRPAVLSGFSWTCTSTAAGGCGASSTGTGSINKTLGTLASGDSVTFTATGTVSSNAPLGSFSNTATVTAPSTVIDPNTANNTATDLVSVVMPIADLSITKTDNTGTGAVFRGQSITYTVIATNGGPNAATGAVVTDSRPTALSGASWSWTCTSTAAGGCGTSNSGTGSINQTLGTLASGDSVTFKATGTVSTTATGASITNTATVAAPATVTDPNLANNTASDTVALNVPTITAIAPTSGTRGANVSVTISGSNLSNANSVTIAGGGVACSGVTAGSGGTSVTANCAITTGAAATARNVTVGTSANGSSNTLTGAFAVTPSIAPTPLTISVTGVNGNTGTVTVTNTAPAGGPSLAITGDTAPVPAKNGDGSLSTWYFQTLSDTCANQTLMPGASCTVQVQFTNVTAASGTNHSVTMTFTESGGGTQSVTLTGQVN